MDKVFNLKSETRTCLQKEIERAQKERPFHLQIT
jgi:hypothetical protein